MLLFHSALQNVRVALWIEFEIVTKATSTGRKTHHIFVGEHKYLSRGIKKKGQAWFYCNFVSVHHKCTSSFRVRYHNLANPMDEIPAIEHIQVHT